MSFKTFLIIGSILLLLIFMFWGYKVLTPVNKNFDFNIKQISIKELNSDNIYVIQNNNKFTDIKISKEVSEKIVNNPESYKRLVLVYEVDNNSDNINMSDVRFNPMFPAELKERVIAYNDSDEVTSIMIDSKESRTYYHNLLIFKSDISDEEIIQLAKEGQIKVSYLTGPCIDTGHGYNGIGKHSKVFNINQSLLQPEK